MFRLDLETFKIMSAPILLFGSFYFLISPVLYVSKFEGPLSIQTSIVLTCLFLLTSLILFKRNPFYAILVSILFAAAIPNEVIGFLFLLFSLVFLILTSILKNKIIVKYDVIIISYALYLLLGSLIGCILESSDFFAYILYLCMFVPPFVLVSVIANIAKTPSAVHALATSWIISICCQLVPILFKPIFTGQWFLLFNGNDLNHGTLIRAHYLGVKMIPLVIFFMCLYLGKKKVIYLFLVAIFTYVFFLTDTKHALIASAVGFIFCLPFMGYILNTKTLMRSMVLAVILVGSISIFLQFSEKNRYSTENSDKYLVFLSQSRKIKFILNTVELLKNSPRSLVLGFGAGTYGSRIASSRATESIAKKGKKLPSFIPTFSSPEYQQGIRGLYTEKDIDNVSGSNALGDPFSSVIGVIAETGLLGLAILLAIYQLIFKQAVSILKRDPDPFWRSLAFTTIFTVPFSFSLGFFDSYYSQPQTVISFFFLFGIIAAKNQQINYQKGYL